MKKTMLAVIAVFFLICGCASSSNINLNSDELTDKKLKDIKLLMSVSGENDFAKHICPIIINELLNNFKESQKKKIPERTFEALKKELIEIIIENISEHGGLMDQLANIYDKYFTHQEIIEMIAFYQTPTGKKSVLLMPKIFDESVMVGKRFSQSMKTEIDDRLMNALKREGLIPNKQ